MIDTLEKPKDLDSSEGKGLTITMVNGVTIPAEDRYKYDASGQLKKEFQDGEDISDKDQKAYAKDVLDSQMREDQKK